MFDLAQVDSGSFMSEIHVLIYWHENGYLALALDPKNFVACIVPYANFGEDY